MPADPLALLRCPHCAARVARSGDTVRCAAGHSFDLARQGYLSLLRGDAQTGSADTAAMVGARSAFLGAGHFDPLGEAVASASEAAVTGQAGVAGPGGAVLDLGAGTGWYLARVLDRLAQVDPPAERVGLGPVERVGLALDLSKHALRRAARAHPRITAVRCDAWRALPVRDGVAALALSVFAPRNAGELARVLRPGGLLVVAAPSRSHLAELVTPLGLLEVDERKADRLAGQLEPFFDPLAASEVEWTMELDHAAVRDVASMGPSAFHNDPATLERSVSSLPTPVRVVGSVTVAIHRRRG